MKRVIGIGIVMACLLMGISSFAQDEKPWFDMENCSVCKPLMGSPGLLEQMSWEHFKLDDGMLSVTSVSGGSMEAYRAVAGKMNEVIEQLMAGETLPVCGMCDAMGACFEQGAKAEKFQTSSGSVSVMTSDNPEVVAKIHAWHARTSEEMAKMYAAPAKVEDLGSE